MYKRQLLDCVRYEYVLELDGDINILEYKYFRRSNKKYSSISMNEFLVAAQSPFCFLTSLQVNIIISFANDNAVSFKMNRRIFSDNQSHLWTAEKQADFMPQSAGLLLGRYWCMVLDPGRSLRQTNLSFYYVKKVYRRVYVRWLKARLGDLATQSRTCLLYTSRCV